MIKINGEVLNVKKFPDGTLLLKEDVPYDFKITEKQLLPGGLRIMKNW